MLKQQGINKVLSLIGRIFIAAIFILSALSKLGGYAATVQYMTQHGIPLAPLFLYAAVFLELVGGVMLAAGYKTKFALIMLIGFLIPTTFIFHFHIGDKTQMVHLLKNLSILGSLLFIFGNGPGRAALTKD